MKTIKESLWLRMHAQEIEAGTQGLNKIAANMKRQIHKNANNIRQNDKDYTYSVNDFHWDVEDKLWDIVVRAADFYGCNLDGQVAQDIIEKAAEDLLKEFRTKSGVKLNIGANEPKVPGEDNATLSVKEE